MKSIRKLLVVAAALALVNSNPMVQQMQAHGPNPNPCDGVSCSSCQHCDNGNCVDNQLSITSPTNLAVCVGSTATFTAAASGSPTPSTQWQVSSNAGTSFGNISGATSGTLTFSANASQNSNQYRAIVANSCGSATSAVATLTVKSVPACSIIGPSDVCPGGDTALYYGPSPYVGMVSSVWSITGNATFDNGINVGYPVGVVPGNSGSFTVCVTATFSNGCTSFCCTNVTIHPPPTQPVITLSPSIPCAGSFSNVASVAASNPSAASYVWHVDGGEPTSGQGTPTIGWDAPSDGWVSIDVKVYGDYSCSSYASTGMLVNAQPSITSSPTNQTACAGGSTAFTVSVSGASPGYQWRKNNVNLSNGGSVSGATSSQLVLSGVLLSGNNSLFDVIVSNSCGSVTSSKAFLTVISGAPSITSQPASQTRCAGQTAGFSVTVPGASLSYQWRKDGVNLSNGGGVYGAMSPSLTISNVGSGNAGSYSVIVANPCGVQTSSVATLALICDGIPDWWKVQYGLSLTDPHVAAADPDGDGYTNLQEYHFGTDPTNALSHTTTVPPYLTGWWKLDEGTGTLTADSSGNGNHGQLFASHAGWVSGIFSNALRFNGVDVNTVEAPISDTLNYSNALSVVTWVKTTNSAPQGLLSYRAEEYTNGWRLFYGTTEIVFQWAADGQTYKEVRVPGSFPSNKWVQVAATFSQNWAAVYFNGVLTNTMTTAGTNLTLRSNNPLTLGSVYNGYHYMLPGQMDQVQVYRKVLSTNEIAALYNVDTDGDGKSDVTENGCGTDPLVPDVITAPLAVCAGSAGNQASMPSPLTTLYSFGGGTNGGAPLATLIQGSDGNFYGTSSGWWVGSSGTVFRISSAGRLTTLHQFNGADGAYPYSWLVQGSGSDANNFYGTTSAGGTNDAGTVFRISTDGALTTLYQFGGVTGIWPLAGLTQGSGGYLYGTTRTGGANNAGTVFKISTNGALTTLHSFNPATEGTDPFAGLARGTDGYFYGTTIGGGGPDGYGTIFKISTNGDFTALYVFMDNGDGAEPFGTLVQGSDSGFYGTTRGEGDYGSVFRVTTNGALTVLHHFGGGIDGSSPHAGLVQGSDGRLYGTTTDGAMDGAGSVYMITTNGTLTTLYNFSGDVDGYYPYAGLVQGDDGYFYGTTSYGGAAGNGSSFRIAPTTYTWSINYGTIDDGQGTRSISWTAGVTNPVTVCATTISAMGCTNSSCADVAVNALPTATAGNSSPVCAGETLDLTASTVTGATYSWTGPDGFASSSQNVFISGVTTTASGTYTVTVTRNGCSADSSTTVTVESPPVVVTNPVSRIVTYGSNVTFSVAASGTGSLTYQWRKNATNIPGATSSSYSIVQPGVSESGSTYDVVVSRNGCSVTSSPAVLTVNPKVLTVTANSLTREYGLNNPSLTYTNTGFVAGEGTNVLSGAPALTTIANAGSPVGFYPLSISTGTLGAANYSFTFVNGQMTVTKASLSVTANNATKFVGDANPPLTGTITGLRNNDPITATYSTTATTNSVAGNYTITPAWVDPAAKLGNYNATLISGSLSVSNPAVTVNFTSTGLDYMLGRPPTPLDGSISLTVTGTVPSGYFNGKKLMIAFTRSQSNDHLTVRNAGSGTNQIRVSALLNGDGSRNITNNATYIGTCKGGTPQEPLAVTFANNASTTNVQNVLRNVSFSNTSTSPSEATREVSVVFSNEFGARISSIITIPVHAQCPNGIDAILVLDKTGSMSATDVVDAANQSRLQVSKSAATNFLGYLELPTSGAFADRVSVIAFPREDGTLSTLNGTNTQAGTVTNMTYNPTFQTNKQSIANAILNIPTPLGSTMYDPSLKAAHANFTNLYSSATYDSNRLQVVIFITDGQLLSSPIDNCNDTQPCYNGFKTNAINAAQALTEKGARVLTIGFAGAFTAEGSNVLQQLASSWPAPDDSLIAPSNATLRAKYAAIASGVCRGEIKFNSSLNYTENAPATVIDPLFEVNEPSTVDFSNDVLTISLTPNDLTEDQLALRYVGTGTGQINFQGSIVNYGTISIGTFAGQNSRLITVTLTNTATPAAVQALMRNITYYNASDNPAATNRTVTAQLTDVGGTFVKTDTQITVLPVNDQPTLDAIGDFTVHVSTGPHTVNLTGISTGGETDQTLSVSATTDDTNRIISLTQDYTANDPTGKVLFFAGNSSGTAHITVTVTDDGGTANGGTNSFSRTFAVTIQALQPPSVVIVNPRTNQIFNARAQITLNSIVEQIDGLVTNVSYSMNGTPIGSSTLSPYKLTLSNLAGGTYTFTAVARDNNGLSATSPSVSIYVANQPPTVAITFPLASNVFALGESIPIQAVATDVDGVSNVEFRADNVLLGNDPSAPYSFTWTSGLPTGWTTLTAVAWNSNGLSATSAQVPINVQGCTISGLSDLALSVSKIIGGNSLLGTLTLSNAAPTGGQAVTLSTSDPAAILPLTVFVPQGSTTATFPITTRFVDITTIATISATYHQQAAVSTNLTITLGSNGGGGVGGSHTNGQAKWASPVGTGGPVEGSPAIGSNGTLYVTSRDGKLYSINPDTGAVNWSTNLQNTAGLLVTSPALGTNGTIYVCATDGGSARLYAINPNGTNQWPTPYELGSPFEGGPDEVGVSTPAVSADGTIYVTLDDYDSILFAINPDGTKKWDLLNGLTFNGSTFSDAESSPAIGPDCTIYFMDELDLLHAVDSEGNPKWTWTQYGYFTDFFTSVIAIGSDGTIYLGFVDLDNNTQTVRYRLSALNPDNTEKWSFRTEGPVIRAPSIAADGTVYFGATTNLYAVDTDGNQKWVAHTSGTIQSTPAIAADGTIYFGATTNLYALSADDGTQKWVFPASGEIKSSPAIGLDGTVYFGAGTNFYAVYGSAPLANSPWPMFNRDISHSGAQCLTVQPPIPPVANVIFVRDDLMSGYTPFQVNTPQFGAAAIQPSQFDTKGIWGLVMGARFQRTGTLQVTAGSKFDVELGICSGITNGAGSFGLLLPNAHQLTTTNYSVEWSLPAAVYPDLQSQLNDTCSLPLSNRVSSVCGGTYVVTDTPQTGWPLNKNILTLAVDQDLLVPQGRCRDFVLTKTDSPVNGTWDIVFREQIIASSGRPGGWDVEEDYTFFGGFTITVPASAVADAGYEVRVRQPDWPTGRSTQFAVVPAGAIASAPVLLPMRLSTNTVGSTTTATLTIALDAPAPVGGAYVTLRTNGVAGVAVPAYVVIPEGQTNLITDVQVGGSMVGTQEIFASFNGYRKAKVRVATDSCTTQTSPAPSAVVSESTILVTWNSVNEATSYEIRRSTDDLNYVPVFSGLKTNRFVDTDVLAPTTYYYQVKSLSNACESSWSDPVNRQLQNPFVAPAPFFIPSGGIFNNQAQVVVTNYLPNSTIYYTTNGTPPTFSSSSFPGTGTILLTSNTTIKAFAANGDYTKPSRIVSANFTIITPSSLECGTTTSGSLSRTNAYSPVDGPGFYSSRFAFTTDIGKLVTITAHSDDFDTYLYLKEGTNVVAVNDDYLDNSGDSQIEFRIRTNAVHEIEVTSYWPGETGNFTLNLTCVSTPELKVFTNSVAFPNAGLIDFGALTANVSAARSIIVSNSGYGDLQISSLSITQNANGFSILPSGPFTISHGNTQPLTVQLLGTQVGDYSGYLIITNTDATRNPFYVNMIGRVRAAAGPPEVSIYFPTNGMSIPDALVDVGIGASAWDEDGIQKVEFYTNNILYQTVFNWPYSVTWSSVAAGSYTVSAIAYDQSTPQQWSTNSVSFTVGLPTLTLTPTNACVGLSNTTFIATALLKNESGAPINNATVTFTITGVHNTTGTATTSSGGTATFTYTGTNYGPDRIKATATPGGDLIESGTILKNWARRIQCNDLVSDILTNTDGYSIACHCAEPSRYADFYSFTGTNGQDVTFTMTSTNFEPFVVLMDTSCGVLAETNDTLSATNTQIRYTLTADGTYIVEASSFDIFQTGAYTLKMECGAPTAPHMGVLSSGTNVPNFGTIDLGTTNTGSVISQTLVITNQGAANLVITNKDPSAGFGINLSPAATITAGSSASYTLTFSSANPGIYQGYLILWNNDSDRNPFVLVLKAIANPSGTPPTVDLLAPTNGTRFVAPAGFEIQAQASASGGATITNVDFYATTALGSVKIGSKSANSPLISTSISWSQADPGRYVLQAVAFDNAGRAAISPTKTVEIYPSNQNHSPLASNDVFSVNANSINNDLAVLANDTDPDGDPLTIITVGTPSSGTATIIDNGQKIRYTPQTGVAGNTAFGYIVSDGRGGTAYAVVNVKIDSAPIPKINIVGPMPTNGTGTLTTGFPTNFTLAFQTPTQVIVKVEYFLGSHLIGTVTDAPFTNFTWLVRQDESCDCRSFQATAYDVYGQRGVSPSVQYSFTNTSTATLVADIQSPAPVPYSIAGQTQYNPPTVSDGILMVTGSVYELNGTLKSAAEYKLLIETPDGNVLQDSGWLAQAVIESNLLKTLDLTTLENGPYDLELLVRSTSATTSKTVRFMLNSQLKMGQFSFSQQDVAIPMAGIPLTVIRTYNSLSASRLEPNADFSPGWTYALKDMDVQIDEQREETEDAYSTDAYAETYSLRTGGGRDVTLTLPDGRRVTFAFRFHNHTVINDTSAFIFGWDAPPGVNYQLTSIAESTLMVPGLPNTSPFWRNGNYGGPEADVHYDFPRFVLTAPDGTKYNIIRKPLGSFGYHIIPEDQGYQAAPYGPPRLSSIELPDGNTLTFTDDGVVHSAGKSLIFQRDFNGRISAIKDPSGQQDGIPVVKYEYDAAGNLATVSNLVDRAANPPLYRATTYLYEKPNFPHYITSIKDSRGLTPLRNLYDDSGKLIGVIDAFGKTNRFVHDITGKTETVYDRMGNQTIHEFDARGNIVHTIDAAGGETFRTYDGANNLLSETDPLGHTTSYGYDGHGNRTNVIDALNRVNSFTYDGQDNQKTHTDPLGNVTENFYDSAGHLTNTVSRDPFGKIVTQSSSEYDTSGNLTTNRDALGHVVASFGYDGSGNLTGATDANGFTRSFLYDSNGNQTNSSYYWVNPANLSDTKTITTSTIYDSAGRVTRAIDADGQTNVTVYDNIGKVASTTNKFGLATSYTYDARGNLVQTIYPDGTVTRTVYDDNSRAIVTGDRVAAGFTPASALAFPRATRSYYDALGRVTAAVRLTNAVVTINNNAGVVSAVLNGAGTTISTSSTEYYDNGLVKSRTGPDQQKTGYEYYDDGQLKAVVDPLGKRTEYEYDEAGRRQLVRDALQHVTQFGYDAVGRQVTTLFHDYTFTSNIFNNVGQKVAETDQAGLTTYFQYSASGSLTNVTKPAVADADNSGTMTAPQWGYQYDNYGRLFVTRDPKGRVTTNTYDAVGRQISRILPMGQSETNQYDSFGRLWKKYDFKGQLEQLSYDSLSRVQSHEFYTNNASQLAKRICISYDELGRQKKIVELTGTALSNSCATVLASIKSTGWPGAFAMLLPMMGLMTFPWRSLRNIVGAAFLPRFRSRRRIARLRALRSYRPTPRWIRLICTLLIPVLAFSFLNPGLEVLAVTYTCTDRSNPDIRITEFTYDADGHVTQICSPEGTINYLYDLATGRHTNTWTTSNNTGYTYDELGRLKTLEIKKRNGQDVVPPEIITYTYTDVGSRDSVTLPNGITTKYTYDSLNRLKKLENRNTSNLLLSSYDYLLQSSGRRTNATEIVMQSDDNTYVTNNIGWTYDDMYRLTQETRTTSPGSPVTDSYTYDLVGNRKTKATTGSSTVNYNYNTNDQLTNEVVAGNNTVTYLYDANGSLTNKTVISGSVYNFSYNAQNQLSSVTVDGGAATTYLYNHAGIRARAGGATTQYFLTDPINPTGYAQVLEEGTVQSGTFNLSRSYVVGDDILAQVTSGQSPATSYLLYDGHGSTRQLSQTTGTGNTDVLQQYNYDAYGVGLGLPSSPQTSYLYAGEQFDSVLKQYYLRARYYDPSNGRFNQLDSFTGNTFDPQSLHKYAYAGCDPINGIDPSGNETLVELMVTTAIDVALDVLEAIELAHIYKTIKHGFNPTIEVTAAQVPAFHKQLALLSSDVYNANLNPALGWLSTELGIPHSDFVDGSFFARLYVNSAGTDYVLAFRGTNPTEFGDWYTNLAQGALGPFLSTQYDKARTLALQVKQKVGGANLTMTGHSLGGGLASAAAIVTQSPGVTFNAAGLNSFTELYDGALHNTSSVIGYSVEGEILTGVQNTTFAPEAYGHLYKIKPADVDAGADPITLHSMDVMKRALGI